MIRWSIRLVALLVLGVVAVLLYDRWQMREDFGLLRPLDPMPQTRKLIDAGRLAEAEAYLGYFIEHNSTAITPRSRALLDDLRAKRRSWDYRLEKLVEGAIEGKSDEIEGMVGAGVADLFVVGDIRDAVIEGAHWLEGEEVDEVILALSSLGIAATAATITTVGGTGGLKGSLSLLKQMHKAKHLPDWLVKALLRLPRAADIRQETRALLTPIMTLYREGGWQAARDIIRRSRSLGDLQKLTPFVRTFGRESAVLLRIDPAAARLAEHWPARTITRASLYGQAGFERLARRLAYAARVSKYVSKQWQIWLRTIPVWMLILIGAGALYFVLPGRRWVRRTV